MIYQIAPKYGRKNPLIYLSICSTSGSVSIMFIKAFGIALKMTFAGNNQFTHPSTYAFMIVSVHAAKRGSAPPGPTAIFSMWSVSCCAGLKFRSYVPG